MHSCFFLYSSILKPVCHVRLAHSISIVPVNRIRTPSNDAIRSNTGSTIHTNVMSTPFTLLSISSPLAPRLPAALTIQHTLRQQWSVEWPRSGFKDPSRARPHVAYCLLPQLLVEYSAISGRQMVSILGLGGSPGIFSSQHDIKPLWIILHLLFSFYLFIF